MPQIITIRKADVLKGMPLRPGWYKGKVKSVGKMTTKGDRVDVPITLEFDDPEMKKDEIEVDHTFFNALGSGIGFVVSFIAALQNAPRQKIADQMESSFDFDFDSAAGKPIQFKLINQEWEGRLQNRIQDFLPHDTEVGF